MKRCPQCEFIYEDDQNLCDMDGASLVVDSRTLPNLHALTSLTAKAQSKRNRAVPAFATLILALVLGMVYYVSVQRRTVQGSDGSATTASTAIPNPQEATTPELAVEVSEVSEPAQPEEEAKPIPSKSTAPETAKKPAARTGSSSSVPVSKNNGPAPQEKKDDSKVGSILKKTGRILKKPFKF